MDSSFITSSSGCKPLRHVFSDCGPYNVILVKEIYSLISYLRQSKPQALEALLIDSVIYRGSVSKHILENSELLTGMLMLHLPH